MNKTKYEKEVEMITIRTLKVSYRYLVKTLNEYKIETPTKIDSIQKYTEELTKLSKLERI